MDTGISGNVVLQVERSMDRKLALVVSEQTSVRALLDKSTYKYELVGWYLGFFRNICQRA